jgi:hypothetical protein
LPPPTSRRSSSRSLTARSATKGRSHAVRFIAEDACARAVSNVPSGSPEARRRPRTRAPHRTPALETRECKERAAPNHLVEPPPRPQPIADSTHPALACPRAPTALRSNRSRPSSSYIRPRAAHRDRRNRPQQLVELGDARLLRLDRPISSRNLRATARSAPLKTSLDGDRPSPCDSRSVAIRLSPFDPPGRGSDAQRGDV